MAADYAFPGLLPPDISVTRYANGNARVHFGSAIDQSRIRNLDAHHVTIDGKVYAIPFHGWNQTWTNRVAPLSPKRSPAELVAANRMFPLGMPWANGSINPVGNYIFTGPMDSAGITKYFPTTGERPDLGWITDPSAQYMLGGSAGPMLAWAQGIGSCPMHFRDETTGKPLDLLKYPGANQYSGPQQGGLWLQRGPPVQGWPMYADTWEPQQAHYGEFSYVAYQATLDSVFLEDLQYSANFMVLADAWLSGQRGVATIYGEYRGIAWSFRNLFMAHAATLDAEAAGTLPASCHLSSYWKKLLDNQLAYYSKFIADPANQVFRLVSGPATFGPWQVDYMLTALAFGVLTGHADWAPLYLWALKNAIDRTSGKSGYPVGYGSAYYMPDAPDWKTSWLTGIPTLGGAEPPTAAQIATLAADPFNGGKAMNNAEYLMTTHAVLVMAQYLHGKGLVDVKAVYPDLDLCVTNVTRMLQGGGCNARVSVVLDASASPVTLPPIPPPVVTPPDPPPVKPPEKLPATLPGIVTRVSRLKTIVGA